MGVTTQMPESEDTINAEIGIPSKDLLVLEAHLLTKKDGEFVLYEYVKKEFDIDLKTPKGRSKFYTACKRNKLSYQCKPNYGYKLSCPETALPISNSGISRIVSATKNSVRVNSNLLDKHGDTLGTPVKDLLIQTKTTGNAIIGIARSQKHAIQKEYVQVKMVVPVIKEHGAIEQN